MPISSRLVVRSTILLLGVGFLTLVAIVAATIWLGERAHHSFEEVIKAREIRVAAVELRSALQSAESSQRGFQLSGNQIYLAPYDNAKAQTRRHLGSLEKLLANEPDMAGVLGRLRSVIAEKIKEMDQSITLKRDELEQESLALLQTNRGKALMDEANLFLSGVIRRTDLRLTAAAGEQRTNSALLRWFSILGGLVIVLVVGGVTLLTLRYAREIAQARDELNALNASLEERVKLRTADLARARDHAEVLVAEVNHRVANSLAMVTSMVQLQAKTLNDPAAKEALAETQARIYAIASVHKRLYSSKDVRLVDLHEYLAAVLDHLAASMRNEGRGASLRYKIEPLKLPTDRSINLGVVVTELVTNAFKYAYPNGEGEVRVLLSSLPESRVELLVEDDGVGMDEKVVQGTGLGTRIVHAMASNLQAQIEYLKRASGTSARLVFSMKEAA